MNLGIETAFVLLYFAICVGIGIYSRGKIVDDISYYLAGRQLGVWAAGAGRFATVSSAFTFMGALGLGYRFGLPFLWSIFAGIMAGFLLNQLLLSEIRRSDAMSIADFLYKRYDSGALRLVASIVALLVMFPHIVAQIKGGGVVGTAVLGMPVEVAMVGLTVVFVAYTLMGGLWAVTWTDMFQGVLLVIFMFLPAIVAVAAYGGNLVVTAVQVAPHFLAGAAPVSMWSHLGIMMVFLGALMVFPPFTFWSFTTRDARTLRRSISVALGMGFITYISFIAILGVALIADQKLTNPDLAYFAAVRSIFASNPVLMGLAAAAALAAIMSTTDGILLASSAIVSNDIWRAVKPDTSPASLLRIGRIATLVVGALSLIVSFRTPMFIGDLTAAAAGSAAAAFVFPMVLGVWWRRMNVQGAMAGTVGGYVAFMILSFAFTLPTQTPILIALPISALLSVGVAMITSAPSQAELGFVARLHRPDSDGIPRSVAARIG